MAHSYPLAASDVPELVLRHARFSPRLAQSAPDSPFTFQAETQDFGGAAWALEVELPPMDVDDGEEVIGFGLALNGVIGYFLMEPPRNQGVRGTWSGTPVVKGAHAAGVTSLLVDGFTGTVERGDWFSLGSGANTHLHKLTASGVVGSPTELLLEIWPPLRAAVSDNDPLTIVQPKGLWRLSGPIGWEISLGGVYVVDFPRILEKL